MRTDSTPYDDAPESARSARQRADDRRGRQLLQVQRRLNGRVARAVRRRLSGAR